jgi:large subunit ribosomal protein L9
MQIILRADVRGVGRRGERKEVADGHARNYLIPRGLAVAATVGALAHEAEAAARAATRVRRAARDAEALRRALEGRSVTLRAKAAPGGTLYAAVGPAQVAEALRAEGLAVIPEMVRMTPVKQAGSARATVTTAPGLEADVVVRIESQ